MAYLNPDGSLANYVGSSPDQLDPTNAAANTPGDLNPGTAGTPGQIGAPTSRTGYQPPPYTGDAGAWIQQVIQGLGLQANQSDPTALKTIVQLAQQVGAPIQMDQVDSNGHLGGLIINGQKMQLIDGSNNWTSPQPWPSGGGDIGSLVAPFTGSFTAPNSPAAFQAPAFNAPTAADVLKDPSYQFRLGQGEQALQQSAAARGVLNTGGTLKDVLGYGQDFASQEYGNVYDRSLNAYNLAYKGAYDTANLAQGAYQSNYQNAFQKYLQDYNQYRNQKLDTFNEQFQTQTA